MLLTQDPQESEVLHIFCGRFAGLLERTDSAFSFAVRDAARDQLLVHGENFDLESAFVEVATMLLQLQKNRIRAGEAVISPSQAFPAAS